MSRRRNSTPAPALLTPEQAAGALLEAVKEKTADALRELVEGLSDKTLLDEVDRRCNEDPEGFPDVLWGRISNHISETELDEKELKERCKEAGVPLWDDDAEMNALLGLRLVELSRQVVFNYDMFAATFNQFAVRDLEDYLRTKFNIHS